VRKAPADVCALALGEEEEEGGGELLCREDHLPLPVHLCVFRSKDLWPKLAPFSASNLFSPFHFSLILLRPPSSFQPSGSQCSFSLFSSLHSTPPLGASPPPGEQLKSLIYERKRHPTKLKMYDETNTKCFFPFDFPPQRDDFSSPTNCLSFLSLHLIESAPYVRSRGPIFIGRKPPLASSIFARNSPHSSPGFSRRVDVSFGELLLVEKNECLHCRRSGLLRFRAEMLKRKLAFLIDDTPSEPSETKRRACLQSLYSLTLLSLGGKPIYLA